MTDKAALARLTAELVSSYVGNRSLSETELENAIERLPQLISRVHEALLKIVIETPEAGASKAESSPQIEPPQSIQASQTIFSDHLICLEDGLPFKTLRRHLAAQHGLSAEAYRLKWNLPEDYPMVAAEFASSRSAIAKKIGLGANGRGGKPRSNKANAKAPPGISSIGRKARRGS